MADAEPRLWCQLTDAERNAAFDLGYSGPEDWDVGTETSVMNYPWQSLTNAEQAAALTLGYDATSWDKEYHATHEGGVLEFTWPPSLHEESSAPPPWKAALAAAIALEGELAAKTVPETDVSELASSSLATPRGMKPATGRPGAPSSVAELRSLIVTLLRSARHAPLLAELNVCLISRHGWDKDWAIAPFTGHGTTRAFVESCPELGLAPLPGGAQPAADDGLQVILTAPRRAPESLRDYVRQLVEMAVSAAPHTVTVNGLAGAHSLYFGLQHAPVKLSHFGTTAVLDELGSCPGLVVVPVASGALGELSLAPDRREWTPVVGGGPGRRDREPEAPPVPPNFRSALCHAFENTGRCNKGGSCTFAHGRGQLRTSLCTSFAATGKCEYGAQCRFAHGEADLREKPAADLLWKTQLCAAWRDRGQCFKGGACNFAHGESDLRHSGGSSDGGRRGDGRAEGSAYALPARGTPPGWTAGSAGKEQPPTALCRRCNRSTSTERRPQAQLCLCKTALCFDFNKGRCTREDCPFAHGPKELRQLPAGPSAAEGRSQPAAETRPAKHSATLTEAPATAEPAAAQAAQAAQLTQAAEPAQLAQPAQAAQAAQAAHAAQLAQATQPAQAAQAAQLAQPPPAAETAQPVLAGSAPGAATVPPGLVAEVEPATPVTPAAVQAAVPPARFAPTPLAAAVATGPPALAAARPGSPESSTSAASMSTLAIAPEPRVVGEPRATAPGLAVLTAWLTSACGLHEIDAAEAADVLYGEGCRAVDDVRLLADDDELPECIPRVMKKKIARALK